MLSFDQQEEDLLQQCVEILKSEQRASVSLFQRRLRLGYTRAVMIMDELERRKIVGPSKGAEPRDILLTLNSQPTTLNHFMFQQLQPLLRKGDTLTVTIALDTDPTKLRVNVFPKLFTLDGDKGADRKALNTPLTMVATPAEFDGPEFIDTLTKFGASITETRSTLEEVTAAHKTAADEARKKTPKTPAKKTGAPASSTAPSTKNPQPSTPPPASAEDATPSLI
jgi:PRTRC genetic system protein E